MSDWLLVQLPMEQHLKRKDKQFPACRFLKLCPLPEPSTTGPQQTKAVHLMKHVTGAGISNQHESRCAVSLNRLNKLRGSSYRVLAKKCVTN